MAQKMYFTINGERIQRIFEGGDVSLSLPYLEKILSNVTPREDYTEYEYGPEVEISVLSLMRYIEGAGVEVVSE